MAHKNIYMYVTVKTYFNRQTSKNNLTRLDQNTVIPLTIS